MANILSQPLGRLRLGVNIDHVATVRNARGGAYPDPLRAAKLAEVLVLTASLRTFVKIGATSRTATSTR